jgi:putative two-component system response regulator
MKKPPVRGRDVIVEAEHRVGVHDAATLAMAKEIVYTHHERWDGAGYPEGLADEQIPIPGRVVAIVDMYDALVTRRVYRKPLSHDEAVDLIVEGRGTQFDPAVVDAFLQVVAALRDMSALT